MNGHRLLLDTNILIMLVDGNEKVAELLEGSKVYISFVTELELLSTPSLNKNQTQILESLLADCNIIDITPSIKSTTIAIRRKHKVKLPDAIIASTAINLDIPFITADRGFKSIEGLALVLFEL
jgi:predicted nucleic acid-binding protein